MSRCRKCGAALVDGAVFCHLCGTKQNKYALIKKLKKITLSEHNYTDKQATEHISNRIGKSKKLYKTIVIGILAGLVAFSLGFASYYISLTLLSSNNAKKTNTYSEMTGKPKNNSNGNTADTSTNKDQLNDNKDDNSSNNVTYRINSSDDYIFPQSATKKLLDSDLATLSKEDLALARNEIFARHGHVFETEPFKSYFNGKSWYKPDPNAKENDEELNDVEKYNVQIILKYEKK